MVARSHTRGVRAGRKQERHRHRIEHGNKRQGQQPDRSLEVGRWHANQFGEISHGANVGFRAATFGVGLRFLDPEVCKGLCLTLTRGDDVGAIAALLVGNRHRSNGTTEPRRFLDRCIDLGNAPIEVGDALNLDRKARLSVGGPIRERQIEGHHVVEVSTREESEYTDCVQAHQDTDHRDKNQTQKGRCRAPVL